MAAMPCRAGLLSVLLLAVAAPVAACEAAGGRPAEGESAAARRVAPRTAVTYIGNEGFLIAGGGKKVLVDALYREGVRGYEVIPEARRARAEHAQDPFDDVDLVLATHVHPDHFDAEAVGTHLMNNHRAIFISTGQAIAKMRDAFPRFAEVRDRVWGITPAEGETVRRTANGIEIEVIYLHHGRTRPFENLGFLFTLGGKRFLHVGDTEATEDDFRIYDLAGEKIDVAFVPYWFLIDAEGRAAIRRAIRPRRIMPMHVPPRGSAFDHVRDLGGIDRMLDRIEADVPNARAIREPMRTEIIE